ncbi:MAG: alkaline phosphatase D family protein, partial [Moraxellaceae bacterium]
MVAVWDDHEFSDDSWQASETYTNANNSQPNRRRNANQAWFEFMPADIVFSETDSSFQNIRIYRDLKFGTVVHLVMTDQRLYRTDHLIAESTTRNGVELGRINSRYLAPEATLKLLENLKSPGLPAGAPADADALALTTMLGKTQRQWWKDTMSGSTATWKVWGNEVSLLRIGLNGTNALAEVISLSIFGALTGSGSTGIAQIPAAVSTALATQIATAPATPATTTVVVALTPQLVGAGLSSSAAQTLATNVAVAVAGGADNTAKYTAAYTVLTGAGIPDPQADALATAAVGVYNRALEVGNLVIATAITGAVGKGAATALAGQAAYAITARSATSMNIVDLISAATSAGLNATQAQAAAGAFLNALAVGDITIASAVAGAGTANAAEATAAQAALAITAADADPAATTAIREGAGQLAGLTATQASTAVAAYEAAKAAKPAGVSTQIQAAANQIAFVKASADMKANKGTSPFFLKATGAAAPQVAAFFQKFIINADQWDGYRKERTELMKHLITNNIQNVVAVTGDIHAFFAGQVYDEFAGEIATVTAVGTNATEATAFPAGTPAMVDLVTAGISSTSWFNYLKAAADQLDPTNALIGKLVYIPVPVAVPANGLFGGSPALNFTANLNLLDYTVGKPAPADANALALQLTDQLKRQL